MTSLIQKIFGKSSRISVENAKPFFNQFGINIEDTGLPGFRTVDSSYKSFDHIHADLVLVDGVPKTIINGVYILQFKAVQRSSPDGIWRPGPETYYRFKIEDGKLNWEWSGFKQ